MIERDPDEILENVWNKLSHSEKANLRNMSDSLIILSKKMPSAQKRVEEITALIENGDISDFLAMKKIDGVTLLGIISSVTKSHILKAKKVLYKSNPKNASGDRKIKPTKETVEKFKGEFIEKRYSNHGDKIERGWKKAAANRFDIDIKTLNKILK